MPDLTVEQRYANLRQKVVERKTDFEAFINVLETKTCWLTSPASIETAGM